MSEPKTPPPAAAPDDDEGFTPDPLLIDDPIHGDWTKQSWDLPPYKSPKFFYYIPESELDHFRTLPVYKFAVKNGLIKDDEWTGKAKGVM
jgi:hypothetical protein